MWLWRVDKRVLMQMQNWIWRHERSNAQNPLNTGFHLAVSCTPKQTVAGEQLSSPSPRLPPQLPKRVDQQNSEHRQWQQRYCGTMAILWSVARRKVRRIVQMLPCERISLLLISWHCFISLKITVWISASSSNSVNYTTKAPFSLLHQTQGLYLLIGSGSLVPVSAALILPWTEATPQMSSFRLKSEPKRWMYTIGTAAPASCHLFSKPFSLLSWYNLTVHLPPPLRRTWSQLSCLF